MNGSGLHSEPVANASLRRCVLQQIVGHREGQRLQLGLVQRKWLHSAKLRSYHRSFQDKKETSGHAISHIL